LSCTQVKDTKSSLSNQVDAVFSLLVAYSTKFKLLLTPSPIMKHFTCFLFILITHIAVAQDLGSLKGAIMEGFSQEPIQYASLSLQLEGALVAQTRADVDGIYLFMDIEAGSYNLIISKLGLSPLKITNVLISPNEISELNLTVEASGFDQDTIVFTYSELQQKSLPSNSKISKKHCTKRQLRATRKLEKQTIH
jgi:hypothetical protein